MIFGTYPQNAITQIFAVEKLDAVCPGDNIVFEFNGSRYIRIITNAAYDEYITKTGVKIGKGNKLYFKFDPIEWNVVEENDKYIELESVYILDDIIYKDPSKEDQWHQTYNESLGTNYVRSDLRKWLIDYFYNIAFSEEEKKRIIKDRVNNSRSSRTIYDYDICEDTFDAVYVLSEADAMKGKNPNTDRIKSDPKLIAVVTDYVKAKGVNVGKSDSIFKRKQDAHDYWTRSPIHENGLGLGFQGVVRYDGTVFNLERYRNAGIKPRIKIKK
jgi:hypothetical protein